MTAPINHHVIARDQAEAEFALARSRCIDAFVDFEVLVGRAGKRLGLPANRDCLGRRIVDFATLKPSPSLSKEAMKSLPQWIEQSERLLSKRASIVHSRMELGKFEIEWRASFANAFDVVEGNPSALVFTKDAFVALERDIRVQAQALRALVRGLPDARPTALPNPAAPLCPTSANDPPVDT